MAETDLEAIVAMIDAPFANVTMFTPYPSGVRLTFAEVSDAASDPTARAAVFLPTAALLELHRGIGQLIDQQQPKEPPVKVVPTKKAGPKSRTRH